MPRKVRPRVYKLTQTKPGNPLPTHSWFSEVTMVYITVLGEYICAECANQEEGSEIYNACRNLEDDDLWCSECGDNIPVWDAPWTAPGEG